MSRSRKAKRFAVMRATLLMAAFFIASIGPTPKMLATDVPQIIVEKSNCAAAKSYATSIAETLALSQSRVTCNGQTQPLAQTGASRMPAVPNLITYSIYYPRSNGEPSKSAPRPGAPLIVPSDIPFVAASGAIIAYVKLDALLLSMRPYNVTETAFALEDAGISRADIISEDNGFGSIQVRVRPITADQVLKITRIAKQQTYFKTGFVRDCDDTIASLSGLSIVEAREHATVMAHAAHTDLGSVLGVIDSGANVPDAVCGFGKESSTKQLVAASEAPPSGTAGTSPLYATVIRSIGVAWRLQLPPNPPGISWRENPEFIGRWWLSQPGFVGDGLRAVGGALVPYSIEPNRVLILIPDSVYAALVNSPYAGDLTHVSFGTDPLQAAVVMQAESAAKLKEKVAALKVYLSRSASQGVQPSNLSFFYARDDCRFSMDVALYRATENALTLTHAKSVRYLEEQVASTIGDANCTLGSTARSHVMDSNRPASGATYAKVVVGY